MAQDEKDNSGAQRSLDQSSGVDERLLSRVEKKKEEKREKQASSQGGNSQAYQSYRTAVIQARKRKAVEKKKQREKKRKMLPNPMRKGTSSLLKQAWINIIPSFGLTIIWINIHVFLGTVFGDKFFCKLGAEWIDGNIQMAKSADAKAKGKVIGTFEGMGLVMLDLGCLILLIIVISIIAMIITAITNPLEAIKMMFGGLWSFISAI